jgi:hypothetical protein
MSEPVDFQFQISDVRLEPGKAGFGRPSVSLRGLHATPLGDVTDAASVVTCDVWGSGRYQE